MKIVVNTISVKKKSGGAFQISLNFIRATILYPIDDVEWFYITSEDLDKYVGNMFKQEKGKRYFVFPTQPDFFKTYMNVSKKLKELEGCICPDVIYSISSPCYFSFKSKEVMRFANAWVTCPNKYAWNSLNFREKLYMKFYCYNQRRLLRKAEYILTQSQSVKEGLLYITKLPAKNIAVVPNVLPDIMKQQSLTPKVIDEKWHDIACVAAPFSHKNLSIIPYVLKELRDRHNICNVRFHMTIPYNNILWKKIFLEAKDLNVGAGIVNHGYCSQSDLADIYRSCQICFVPTLLETFSATILEAAYFGLNIVATDFYFNREILNDAAIYFEPTNSTSAANAIVLLLRDKLLKEILLQKSIEYISKYMDYKQHYYEIVSFLKSV